MSSLSSSLRWFASSLLAGLSLGAELHAPNQGDYLPLHEGDEWTMDVEIISPKGQRTVTTGHRKVGERVERDGKTYHRTRTWVDDPPFESVKLTRKDETGFYSIDEGDKDAKEQIEVMLPMKVGQSWERMTKTGTVRDTVIGLESVTVGEKTYENCFHIRSVTPDGSFKEDYYEAANVGSVKSDMVYGNGGSIKLKLRKFKSGK